MTKEKKQGKATPIFQSEAILKAAIKKLETFAQASANRQGLRGLDIVNEELIVEQTEQKNRKNTLLQCFFRIFFGVPKKEKQVEKKQRILQSLLQAIDIVKSHYRIIDHYIEGSKEERKWAHNALETIHQCNAIIQKINHPTKTWKDRIIQFLSKKNGWDIEGELGKATIFMPKPVSVENSVAAGGNEANSKRLSRHSITLHPTSQFLREEFTTPPPSLPPSQVLDIFRMKAITLIGNEALPITSVSEALRLVRETPIEVHRNAKKPSILSLSQTVLPFPGESIQCTGSFVQENRERGLLPIAESFRLNSKSMQSGFPHPSQTSWALSDALIPQHPLRPHKIPLFHNLARKKAEFAHALLPKGSYNSRAKQLLNWRKEIYCKEKQHFLYRHQQITEAIIQTSDSPALSLSETAVLHDFYTYLHRHTHPFSILFRVQEVLRESYIQQPYEKLSHEWLTFAESGLTSRDPREKAAYASQILFEEREYASRMLTNALHTADEPEKKALVQYILVVGERIGHAVHPIMLQEMSEKIGFTPPLLNDFARKILTAALQQVENFIQEIHTSWEEGSIAYREMIEKQWEREYAIYTAPCFLRIGDPIALLTQELERYYRQRFFHKVAPLHEKALSKASIAVLS